MGDACSRCGGLGRIVNDSRSDPGKPCWLCGGSGLTRPGPRKPKP